jgi:hypothetical protein
MAMTLDDVVLNIGARLKDAIGGNATGGTATTLIDTAALWHPDNAWVNQYLRILTGAYAGQDRLITASAQASKTLTFDPALSGPIVNGVQYQILPLRRERIVQAVQNSIRAAGQTWLVNASKQDIAITGAQEYDLPVDVVTVNEVYAGAAGYWYPLTAFEVKGASGALKLMLREMPGIDAVQDGVIIGNSFTYIRVDYTAMPSLMSAGADTLGVGTYDNEAINFIIEYSLYLLKMAAFDADVTGAAARGSLAGADRHLQAAQEIKARAHYVQGPGRIRTMTIPRQIQ